ncbi:Aste57867_12708 [Aphanomyces stellatus]|uniref:Aste57867_12708 protein n=1 Tax=Aphanomyces stellatus TaxID=120398 RepID=A0A485KYA6_9STRA|nr:hypothetical protein As57867_012660 [Aphanomyces stellatus]VFT89558.1 Aste57867_12708 [Aphanomyces stellatus]
MKRQAVKQLRLAFSAGIAVGSVAVLLALDVLPTLGPDDDSSKSPSPVVVPAPSDPTLPVHAATRFGYPSKCNLKVREGYVLSYDRRLRNASWVAEYVTRDSLKKHDNVDRLKSSFKADPTTPESFRVLPAEYLNSGYDRGHLAPARDMSSSQDSINESFLMTNISPQVGKGFNRGYWSRFEGFIRHLASHYGGVYVITGPLFLPSRMANSDTYEVRYPILGSPTNGIAVPTHFFKVVLVEVKRKNDRVQYLSTGFVLPNQAIPDKTKLVDFIRPIEYIERVSGLLFFDQLRQATNTLQLCNDIECTLPVNDFKASVKANSSSAKTNKP